MRITGGQFGGRIIKTPKGGDTRPTQDRVREALFSMLMEAVPGSRFLDLYAGTGAVGLEALSRGASDVRWVERDRATAALAAQNVAAIAGGDWSANVVVSDVDRWARTASAAQPYEIVFADPPYAEGRENGLMALAGVLLSRDLLVPGGLFITEVPDDATVAPIEGLSVVRDRTYGKSRIVVRQRGNP